MCFIIAQYTHCFSKMTSTKKSRSSNFTREEELLLVDEVRKRKHVIECKTSNKVTIKEKEEAWKNVHQSFQSRTTTTRTIEQLKSKYDNLKTKARKDVANNKTVFKKTGGGPPDNPPNNGLDPVTESIIDIINIKTVDGLSCAFDSDSIMANPDIEEHIGKFTKAVCLPNFLGTDKVSPVDENQIVEHSTKLSRAICQPDLLEPENDFVLLGFEEHCVNNKTCTASTNPIPFTNQNPSNIIILTDTTDQVQQTKDNVENNNSNWSEYTPHKLKRQPNKKLRSSLTRLTAKEVYYKRKREILEQTVAEEKVERAEKVKREEEEHKLKIKLLEYEIKIKEIQFPQLLKL